MMMMMMAEKSIGSREECINILTRIVLVYAEKVLTCSRSVTSFHSHCGHACNRDYTSSFSAVTFYQLGKTCLVVNGSSDALDRNGHCMEGWKHGML